jgi:hypothetical protein
VVGSSVRNGAGYTDFWTKAMWFDGKGNQAGTEKVCSDSLFAYSTASAEATPAWVYEKGVVINSTIAVDDGRVYFVESRNPEIKSSKRRKISDAGLWKDQHLVALDLKSGKVVWDKPIDTEDGTITYYLQSTPDSLLISASNTKYHLYAFDPKSGEPQWSKSNPWPSADHSGHFQHPVLLDDMIYLEPNGYNLKTGEIVTTKVGARSGCHTYVGAGGALIYRGQGRQVAIWDREAETVSTFPRLRPSCWLSTIPAAGMLLLPEGGGGCSCGNWMETSIGFLPAAHRAAP